MNNPNNQPSPLQNLAERTPAAPSPSSRALNESSEMYTVNPSTDTVKGQLEKHTNFDSTLMKRVASQGREQAVSRGLTNSTIASQGAMGAVLDRAGDWAKTDAGIYNDRKTEGVRSRTALRAQEISADASKYSADSSRAAQIETANIGAKSALQVAGANNAGAKERMAMDIAGQNARASWTSMLERDTAMARLSFDREELNARLNIERDRIGAEATQSMWSDLSVGLANIDANASPASQQEQANRLFEASRLRQDANQRMLEAFSALNV